CTTFLTDHLQPLQRLTLDSQDAHAFQQLGTDICSLVDAHRNRLQDPVQDPLRELIRKTFGAPVDATLARLRSEGSLELVRDALVALPLANPRPAALRTMIHTDASRFVGPLVNTARQMRVLELAMSNVTAGVLASTESALLATDL